MKFSLRTDSKPIRWLIRIAITAGVIGLLLWLLPVGLREGAEWWLAEQGVETEIEDINLNLFTGIAEITNAKGKNSQGDGFVIGRAYADLTWRSIIDGRIHLLDITLADSKFDIRQDDKQLVSVLGLNLDDLVSSESKPDDNEEPLDIQYGLDKLQLSDVHIRWHAPDFSEDIRLDTGGVLDFTSWTPDEPVPVDIHADLANGSITLRGKIKPFADRISADISVIAKTLDTAVFAPLLRAAGISDLAGIVETETQVSFLLRPNGYDLNLTGPLKIDQARVMLTETGDYSGTIDWKGETRLQSTGEDLNLQLDGQLLANQLVIEQPELKLSNDKIDWQGKVDVGINADGQQIHALGKISAAELNLEQKDGVRLTRLAPAGDIDAKVEILSSTGDIAIDHNLQLETPGWQVALDESIYAGDALTVSATGLVKLAGQDDAVKPEEGGAAGSLVDTSVDLKLSQLALKIDSNTQVEGKQLSYKGQVQTALQGDYATQLKGALAASGLAVKFEGGTVDQGKASYNGDIDYAVAGPGKIDLQGQLALAETNLKLLSLVVKDDKEVSLTTALQQADASYDGKVGIVLPANKAAQARASGITVLGDGKLALKGHNLSQEALNGPGVNTAAKSLNYAGAWSAAINQPQGPDTNQTTVKGDGSLALAGVSFEQGSPLQTSVGKFEYTGPWDVAIQSVVLAEASAEQPSTAPPSTITLQLPGPIKSDDLRWLVAGETNNSDMTGTLDWLSWNGKVDAKVSETTAYSANGAFAFRGLNLTTGTADNGLAISQKALDWQGTVEQPASKSPGAPDVTGELKTEELQVKDRRVGRNLAALNALVATGIDTQNTQNIKIGSASLSGLATMEREDPAEKTLSNIAQINQADLQNLQLTDLNRLVVESATVDGLRGRLERIKGVTDGEADWEFSEWFPAGEVETSDSQIASTQKSETEPFTFRIGNTTIVGDSRFTFKDQTVKPKFGETLKNIKADLSTIDSADPELVSQLDLFANIGRYGEITMVGPVQPFLERPSFDLKGKVSSLDLTGLSPYSALAIGHGVRQGTLNADLKLVSKRGQLDSNAELTLSKVKLEKSGSGKGLEGSLGMPLNQALSLLRDRDDKIKLDLPITGDIENPDFSTGGVIRKAVLKAIQVAVLNYYSPLGVVFAADKLIDLATAVRFDPVFFDPAKTELDDDDRKYLSKLSKLMTDRPGIEIVVCGYATPADRPARIAEIEEAKGFFDKVGDIGDDRTPEEIVTDEDLLELANSRVGSVADYLIEQGIERPRIVACGAKLDSKPDQKPRVEFSF